MELHTFQSTILSLRTVNTEYSTKSNGNDQEGTLIYVTLESSQELTFGLTSFDGTTNSIHDIVVECEDQEQRNLIKAKLEGSNCLYEVSEEATLSQSSKAKPSSFSSTHLILLIAIFFEIVGIICLGISIFFNLRRRMKEKKREKYSDSDEHIEKETIQMPDMLLSKDDSLTELNNAVIKELPSPNPNDEKEILDSEMDHLFASSETFYIE